MTPFPPSSGFPPQARGERFVFLFIFLKFNESKNKQKQKTRPLVKGTLSTEEGRGSFIV